MVPPISVGRLGFMIEVLTEQQNGNAQIATISGEDRVMSTWLK